MGMYGICMLKQKQTNKKGCGNKYGK